MPTKDELANTYPELLTATSDARQQRLIADLHTAYTAIEPPPALLETIRQAVLRAASDHTERPAEPLPLRRRTWWQRSHLFSAAAVLLLAALLVGGGYVVRAATVDPIQAVVERAIAIDLYPAAARAERTGLLHHEHISQSVDGYTVTLWRAYADANQVVLVTTVTAPATGVRSSARLIQPILTDSQGDVLSDRHYGFRSAIKADTQVFISSYDAGSIGGHPATISLHWRVAALEVRPLTDQAAAPPQHPWDRLQGLDHTLERLRPPANTIGQAQLDTRPVRTIPGPFIFDVTLPFVPAHVATPNQTVTVHSIPITLQHVVVTPSEIQVIVEVPATHGLPASNWNPVIRVAVGSWNSMQPPRGDEGGAAAADGTYHYHSSNAPTLAAGQWTLTIDAIDGYDPQHGPPQLHLDGPWVFHFSMP